MKKKFHIYLIKISYLAQNRYLDEQLIQHLDYFEDCFKRELSAYKAVEWFWDYLEHLNTLKDE